MKVHVSFRMIENVQRVVEGYDVCYANNLFESSVTIRVKRKSRVTKEMIERLIRKYLDGKKLPSRVCKAKIVVTHTWFEDEK